jgi:competence protein ComEA
VCEEIKNDACYNEETDENLNTSDGKININTSSLEELMTLSGIGESKAKAIIEYREKNGSFKNIEDIVNVSGISETIYAKIKNNITI